MTAFSRLRRWTARLSLTAAALAVSGCAALFPAEVTVEDRLAALPLDGHALDGPVEIRWNAAMVPYIEAGTDRDLAYALGLVHAHLRASQLMLFKHVAYGRVSELAGPPAADIDHLLRLIDFPRAAPAIVAGWPEDTRVFVQAFVDGLNAYQARAPDPPVFGLLNMAWEPWTLEDIAAIGRVAGTDVNWLAFFDLYDARLEPDWETVWARVLEDGGGLRAAGFGAADRPWSRAGELLAGMARFGSNSLAVAPSRSATGAALLANDPHLGLQIPNAWLLAGYKSPSYHAVGMMIPGLPFMALGRSQHLAWGGTNMRSLASDLYDVTDEPLTTRVERLRHRFWFDETLEIREHALGPVLSDHPWVAAREGEAFALRWVGHDPSDEITALLRANRARSGAEFRAAFDGYALAPLNMVYADAHGEIGMLPAVRQPRRPVFFSEDMVRPVDQAWTEWDDAASLPHVVDPPEGFLASANDPTWYIDRPIGWFFQPTDRVERMADLVDGNGRVGPDDLKALQMDVRSEAGRALAHALARRIEAGALSRDAARLRADLAAWDGDYDPASRGALVFETVLTALMPALYGVDGNGDVPGYVTDWPSIRRNLLGDLDAADGGAEGALAGALEAAAGTLSPRAVWGDRHRLVVGHFLRNVPVLGGFFVIDDYPSGGSRETLMKAAHGLIGPDPAPARYGSQARHVSDMSDPDANWFVLFGGQDGWWGSAAFADQIPLWREGRFIRMPLGDAAVAAAFPRVRTLTR